MKISDTTRKAIILLLFLGLFFIFIGEALLTVNHREIHHFTIHIKSGKVILLGSNAHNDDDIVKAASSVFPYAFSPTCIKAITAVAADYGTGRLIPQFLHPNININAP
jgi:hypothetical protein